MTARDHKFFADAMLGSLARWLRILGYDTAYERVIADDELVRRCRLEERIALTKDRRLVQRRALERSLLIEVVGLGEQLREVLSLTGDDPGLRPLLTRCLECNAVLQPISREEVFPLVPPFVFRTQKDFRICPGCRKVYWAGTHRDRIRRRLARLLEPAGRGQPPGGSERDSTIKNCI